MRTASGAILACLFLSAFAGGSNGTVLHVSHEGGGDFATIQDAVNAAGGGDTISIAPGTYRKRQLYTCQDWTDSVCVLLNKEELTVIGSGPGVVIGPVEAWHVGAGEPKGIVARSDFGCSRFHIANVSLENSRDGLYSGGTSGTVENTTFSTNHFSALLYEGDTILFDDCRFDGAVHWGTHIVAFRQQDLRVTDCVLELAGDYAVYQNSISLESVHSAVVENCTISGGGGAISANGAGMAYVRGCACGGQLLGAVYLDNGAALSVVNSSFRGIYSFLYNNAPNTSLTMARCVIEDVGLCTFRFWGAGMVDVRGCDLEPGSSGTIWMQAMAASALPDTLEMRDNYWHATDPDSIAALILDGNDNPMIPYYVRFQPFSSTPTPARKAILGDVKSSFR